MDNYLRLNSNAPPKERIGANTNIKSEQCCYDNNMLKTQKDLLSDKPFKYTTQNFFKNNNEYERGIFKEAYYGVPNTNINTSSVLRNSTLVKNKGKQEVIEGVPLATTGSQMFGQGDTVIEDQIRPELINSSKTCYPIDEHNELRTFQIFDHLPIRPNMCWQTVVQASDDLYYGKNTRRTKHYKFN